MNGRKFTVAIFWFVTLSIGLAEVYLFANRWITPNWLAAAVTNSLFASIGMWVYLHRPQPRVTTPQSLQFLSHKTWNAYLPTLVILLLTIAAIAASRMALRANSFTQIPIHVSQLAWVVWIPVVEELTFRVGFGGFFRSRLGPLWGAYFSGIFFALAHSQPTLANVLHGKFGVPFGPLLLGLACELLFVYVRRLGPIIALHAACNLTVVLFSIGDSRWLSWLEFLYL